jgi:RNA polymerase sigma factor (sigma-70 family)
MSDTTEPAGVVDRALAGDERAWGELFQQYDSMLHAVGSGFRLAPGDVEDAIQMTWLGFFRNAGSIRSPEKVGPWLATTMRRNCIRFLGQRRREHLSGDCVRWIVVDESATAESRLLVAERNRTLWQVVDRLPPGQRRLVRELFASPDASYHRVAEELSIAVGTIGPTRRRALQQLERMLVKAGVREDDLAIAS